MSTDIEQKLGNQKPAQFTAAELKRMTPDQIEQALEQGQLVDLQTGANQ